MERDLIYSGRSFLQCGTFLSVNFGENPQKWQLASHDGDMKHEGAFETRLVEISDR